jgi:hypothetical protein
MRIRSRVELRKLCASCMNEIVSMRQEGATDCSLRLLSASCTYAFVAQDDCDKSAGGRGGCMRTTLACESRGGGCE